MSNVDPADQELVAQLRVEIRTATNEVLEQYAKKGFADIELRTKFTAIDTKLNEVVDKIHADQKAAATRADEQDARLKAFGERLSRPPGGGPGFDGLVKTLGRKFVESDAFKNAQFGGKFQIQAVLNKTRIKDIGLALKAAGTTIVEGGATTITPPVGAYPIFPRRLGLIPELYPPITMRDLVDVVPLDATNAVEYVTEVWTNNADYQVLEGDKKPQSGVTYTDHTAVVRTIAHFVKVSRQMASDVSFIIATIENRLALFVLLKEDREILYGDNSAGHLWGIMPQATPVATYYPTPGTTDTMIDQLFAADVYIESQFYFPTAYVLNPIDWAKIASLKTSLGTYLLPGSPAGDAPKRLWGLPVVTTPNMDLGDYLCGAFPGNAALFDRETVNVEMAFQNEDDFVRNLITLRAEERVAFAVFAPKAFAKGPFTPAS